jgi:hypothetical protein
MTVNVIGLFAEGIKLNCAAIEEQLRLAENTTPKQPRSPLNESGLFPKHIKPQTTRVSGNQFSLYANKASTQVKDPSKSPANKNRENVHKLPVRPIRP